MREKVHALIVAAGEGRRAGLIGGTKKQFATVSGRPVIIQTLMAFEASPEIDTLVCVIPPADRPYFEDTIARYAVSKMRGVVEGGALRQESVAAGLFFLEKRFSPEDIVLVHDGVRPLVEGALIARVISAAIQHGCAVAALPVSDSLKQVSCENFIERSLPREAVWMMQTPQGFRLGLLIKAMKKAMADGFVGTDEAALMERMGHTIFCVEGSVTNMKITRPADLQVVEALLKGGWNLN